VKALRLAAGGLAWLVASGAGMAAEDAGPIDKGALIEFANGSFEQATGFIIDRTITGFGAEFLREFALAWRNEGATDGVDLTIVERPSARWGSTIFVEYRNQPAARVFLQAGSSTTIQPLALNAARYMAGRVADNALLGLFNQDPDLGKEELP
jgi:curli production assembly/transport component CsgE